MIANGDCGYENKGSPSRGRMGVYVVVGLIVFTLLATAGVAVRTFFWAELGCQDSDFGSHIGE